MIKRIFLGMAAIGIMLLGVMYAGNTHGKTSKTSSDEIVNQQLCSAARISSWGIAIEALRNGADPYTTDRGGRMPLHLAAGLRINSSETDQEVERIDFMRNLIEYVKEKKGEKEACIYVNAKVSGGHYDGWTPLHAAALVDSYDAADLLLNNGAEVDARSAHNNTPLHIARSHNRTAKLLLKRHSDPNAVNDSGERADVSI